MIEFRKMGLGERVKRAVSPAYRREREARELEALRELCRNPDLPCLVNGVLVADGYGDELSAT